MMMMMILYKYEQISSLVTFLSTIIIIQWL